MWRANGFLGFCCLLYIAFMLPPLSSCQSEIDFSDNGNGTFEGSGSEAVTETSGEVSEDPDSLNPTVVFLEDVDSESKEVISILNLDDENEGEGSSVSKNDSSISVNSNTFNGSLPVTTELPTVNKSLNKSGIGLLGTEANSTDISTINTPSSLLEPANSTSFSTGKGVNATQIDDNVELKSEITSTSPSPFTDEFVEILLANPAFVETFEISSNENVEGNSTSSPIIEVEGQTSGHIQDDATENNDIPTTYIPITPLKDNLPEGFESYPNPPEQNVVSNSSFQTVVASPLHDENYFPVFISILITGCILFIVFGFLFGRPSRSKPVKKAENVEAHAQPNDDMLRSYVSDRRESENAFLLTEFLKNERSPKPKKTKK
ncbi:hypothetical protein L596_008238 [Steinernema carpocapsae]|uniref:Uncharacterized protein n=1 Tax=Steinernema carpocapsae TaxID=34508 RepID=A0A4U5PCE2_STECR|nr:hypothetical protein L596_008238 [Steinernema carpocapsae]